jgi:uroporphyrinogen-III synthase
VADRAPSSLAGKRIVVTRPESQSAALAEALRANGAEIISLPLIRIAPPHDLAAFDQSLIALATFDWLILTSQNAVHALSGRLAVLGIRLTNAAARSLRIAAVGKSTADTAQAAGLPVAYTGKGGTAADLVNELASDLRCKHVFLPRSNRAASALVKQLRDLGCKVTEVIAYRTIAVDSVDQSTKQQIFKANSILFFSPSAVHAFLDLVKSGVLCSLHKDIAVGAIGPVTFSALGEAGVHCHFQAQEPTVNEIISGLAAYFAKGKVSSASGVNFR